MLHVMITVKNSDIETVTYLGKLTNYHDERIAADNVFNKDSTFRLDDPVVVRIMEVPVRTEQGVTTRLSKMLDPAETYGLWIRGSSVLAFGEMPARYKREHEVAIRAAKSSDAEIKSASTNIPVA